MSHVLSIARKELRGYFNSAVALIFLATFLAVVLFTFFWVGKFFTRDIADVRPMFEWLPLLLIFLVGALSMRLWSEEQKVGTIEILLTLPVPHWKLVLGKFLAGMTLVALALVLTLGLPITVAMMGDLDGGPVMGGYVAALLLAGAYLSIGLCVSAVTDNQIVSLIMTVVVCAALYLPGADAVAGFFGADAADVLRQIGTGSRFQSILRGVLDVRDLAYYGSLIAAFLTLNTVLLKAKGWGRGPRTQTRRWNQRLLVGLVAVNAVALNLWLAPVASARIDLTEHDEYSLSEVTEDVLGSLDQPLVIRGYFTESTHPLLAPLVPQLKDILAEYKVLGGDKVRVEIVDPSTSEDVEREAQEKFGIKSFPISFADRRQQSVVNVYFHVLLQYGDQFEVLTSDLIEVKQVGMGEPEVSLGNIEYQVTRTIKKLAYGFQSLDALFAALEGKAELTAYITPSTLPESVKTAPDLLKKVVTELQAEAGGKLAFKQEEPTSREARQDLYRRFQFEPYRTSLMGGEAFYLHFVLKVGKREIPLPLPEGGDLTEAALKQMVVEGLKRAAPGFIKTVALWTPPAERVLPQEMPGMPPQAQNRPPQSFNALREQLAASYEVVPADLSSGRVTDDAEVLLLAGPSNLGDKEVRAVDQFLMRGGAVIVLDGRYRLNLTGRSLYVDPVVTGLEKALGMWGVTVPEKLILDEQNDAFPIPVQRDLGNGIVAQDVRRLPYPFFVHVPGTAMSDNIMTSALNAAVFHYASPVHVKTKLEPPPPGFKMPDESDGKPAPRKVYVLMRSSEESWMQKAPNIQPDFTLFPETGFGRPKEVPASDDGPQALAVAITGGFPSVYAYDAKRPPDAAKPGDEPGNDDSRLLRRSSAGARLIVVGSSSFVTDELLQISREAGGEHVLNNFTLIQNMVDWAVADTDILTIRSRGNHTRLLDVKPDAVGRWEWLNYGIVVLGLGVVVGINALRRRTLVPIELDARAGGAGGAPPEKPTEGEGEPAAKEVQP